MLSGCVASVDKWTLLEREWRSILEDYHLRHIHFKEFFHFPPSRPFRALTDADKRDIILRASTIIRDSLLFVFTCTISPIEYRHLANAIFCSRYGSAYGLCVQTFLGGINGLLAQPVDEYQIVNVFIEQGHKNANDAIRLIRLLKQDTDPIPENAPGDILLGEEDPLRGRSTIKIGKFGLGSKSGIDAMLPLQAAAFLPMRCIG